MTDPFWTGLLSGITGSGVVVAVFGWWLKFYFGPYLTQKAKNLATHEDIQRLVDQVRETERIKAEISDSIWDRQARWTYKRDLYIQLVECMTGLIGLEARCRKTEELTLPTGELYREWGERMAEFYKLSEIAMMVVSERACRTLMNYRRTKAEAEDPWSQEQTQRLKAHLELLRDEAKKDLGYGDPGNNGDNDVPATVVIADSLDPKVEALHGD
jgi:hypothetical protein